MKNKTGFETQWEIKVIRCCVNRIRQSIGVNTRDRFLIFKTTEKKKKINRIALSPRKRVAHFRWDNEKVLRARKRKDVNGEERIKKKLGRMGRKVHRQETQGRIEFTRERGGERQGGPWMLILGFLGLPRRIDTNFRCSCLLQTRVSLFHSLPRPHTRASHVSVHTRVYSP